MHNAVNIIEFRTFLSAPVVQPRRSRKRMSGIPYLPMVRIEKARSTMVNHELLERIQGIRDAIVSMDRAANSYADAARTYRRELNDALYELATEKQTALQ